MCKKEKEENQEEKPKFIIGSVCTAQELETDKRVTGEVMYDESKNCLALWNKRIISIDENTLKYL